MYAPLKTVADFFDFSADANQNKPETHPLPD